MKEADSVLSRLFSFPTAHSLEIVFLDGEFVLHDVMGSPDKPGGLSIQLCKSEKKEFYIRYSS